MKDVPNRLSKEESVGNMEQSLHPRRRRRLAVMKTVPIMLSMEVFEGGMVQRGRLAVLKDVAIMLSW